MVSASASDCIIRAWAVRAWQHHRDCDRCECASVANAPVTSTSKATNISVRVVTSSAGEFNATNLSPGVYRVEIGASGFRRFVEEGVTVTAGATTRMDAQLQLGQISESIE